MEPIDLLRKALEEYTKAKDKSFIAYGLGKITKELHEQHIENLTPKIERYTHAIRTLQIYG